MNKFLIIGFGLIGQERFNSLIELQKNNINFSCDIYDPYIKNKIEKINIELQNKFFFTDQFEKVKKNIYDLVIICTPHHVTFEYATYYLKKNFDILVEKPLGRNLNELKNILSFHDKSSIHVGFNYPYYKSIMKLKDDFDNKFFGELISVDFKIGHGNNPDSIKSWKLSKELCGGGALLDPGIHMIDLILFFFGKNIDIISIITWDGFWNTGIDEETKILLKMNKTLISLDLSSVKWRSKFEIDVNGTNSYGRIKGRGRSYGNQSYTIGDRWSWRNGKTQEENEIMRSESDCSESFKNELKDIIEGRSSNLQRTIDGMSIYDKLANKL